MDSAQVRPSLINLAAEPEFGIGTLRALPASCELVRDDARLHLEPRVMQVLVALHQGNGSVITRDELIERCWDGRIVGEDAVPRAIANLRKALATLGDENVAVETITRIGHRLVIPSHTEQVQRAGRRRLLIGGATVMLASAGTGLLLWPRLQPPSRGEALYRKGLEARAQMLPQAAQQSVAYFRQAVEADPEFAPAWGALALMSSYQLELGGIAEQRVAEQQLLASAHKAQALDPDDVDSTLALERHKGTFGRWAEARAEYERLYRRSPDHFLLPLLIAQTDMEMGHAKRAQSLLKQVQDRNQQDAPVVGWVLSYAKWHAGDTAGAITLGEQGVSRWPDNPAVWGIHLHILALGGEPARALDLLNGRVPAGGREQPWIAMLEKAAIALVSGEPGHKAEAIAFARSTLAANPMEYRIAPQVFAALGEPGPALDAFENIFLNLNAANSGALYTSAFLLRRNTAGLFAPPVMPLWKQPRLQNLVTKVGLRRAWAKSGGAPRSIA